ncbi:MAG: RagB/SusD family nutrient uptake outer membrane protein, partial [Dysgonamonadaceae bacterium]|nr:RagB/SusD family nutrient uptake outer membrane protein [Dysgonamonadaceae bacterium]
RSHLAPVSYSLDAIKNERRWELAFESIRWWDLLRWSGPSLEEAGNALNKQKGFTLINAGVEMPMVNFDYKARLQKTQGYWPIPQTEIDLSGGKITQNPGWESDALFTSWNNYK